MQLPEPGPEGAHGSHAYVGSPRRLLRSRALDWLLGALGMLAVLLLALTLFWLSITRSTESPVAPVDPAVTTPAAAPTPVLTPPPGLAANEVWLGDISLDASTVFAAGTPLLDVVGTGVDVTSGPNGLIARHLDLTATVPFDVVAAEVGPNTVLSAAAGGQARVDTSVELLGRSFPVGATGTVEAVGGKLVMVPTSIDLGGPRFISEFLGEAVQQLITFEHQIEGLPEGVVLRSVRVVGGGFRANLTGEDVKLVQ